MSNAPPVVLSTCYYYSLCLTVWTVICSPFMQPTWSVCHQCGYKDFMDHLAKIFVKSTSTALFLSSYRRRQPGLSGMVCSWQICAGWSRTPACPAHGWNLLHNLPRTVLSLACHFPRSSFLLSLKTSMMFSAFKSLEASPITMAFQRW